jgi:hypothetical protein
MPTARMLLRCFKSSNLGAVKLSHAAASGCLVVASLTGAQALLTACGSSPGADGPGDAGVTDATSTPDVHFVVSSNDGSADGAQSIFIVTSDAAPQGLLTIAPLMQTVTVVTGQALPTVAFTAFVGGTATGANWSIDRGELGSISSSGVFTPSGTLGGVGNITAVYGTETATTTISVIVQTTQGGDPAYSASGFDAGTGGYGGVGGYGPGAAPTSTQVTALNATPTADATIAILYPYSGTVWPQGLLAPLLQWNPGGAAIDSVFVDLKENNYEYKGYFAANATPFVNLPIPQGAWNALTLSNAGTMDPVTVTVVFGSRGNALGPYTETWTIANAILQGTIYYNSYGTQLVKNSDSSDFYGHQYGAGTLVIAPGATSPALAAGVTSVPANPPSPDGGPNQAENGTGCRVCHTVSADGKSLVTQASNAGASDYTDTVYIDLANDTTMGAGTSLATASLAYPALYKDGSLLLSSSGTNGMIDGDTSTKLYAMPAGTPITSAVGLPTSFQATLPVFSPDGMHVAFNFWKGSFTSDAGATLTGDSKSLAELDFDGTQTFSNPRVLYTPTNGDPVVFSSFLPNSAGVVFEVELSDPSGSYGFTRYGDTSELWWVDVASGTAHRLDQLNGYNAAGADAGADAGGAIYLPGNYASDGGTGTHPQAQEPTLNYEPTVNPIASGGYAWVVFTSRRMYGNVAQLGPWQSDPRTYPWLDEVTDKKLWVAAVDLNAPPGTDPSHPAFYLPAQELHAGNARGYWSVEACMANGQSCATGTQCCGGYCQPSADAGLVCTSQMPSCAGMYEKCSQTADCCGAAQGITCIDSVCSVSSPPPQTPQ